MKKEDLLKANKYGNIIVNVYKEINSKKSFFYLQTNNDSLLPIMDILEDTLKRF